MPNRLLNILFNFLLLDTFSKKSGDLFKSCSLNYLSNFLIRTKKLGLSLGLAGKLKKNQIVKSTRGIQGGYILSKKPNEIKLNNILNAVDEKVKTVQCKKESKKGCNGKATKCVTHNLWDELETHINTFFEIKSLQDLLKNNSERVN